MFVKNESPEKPLSTHTHYTIGIGSTTIHMSISLITLVYDSLQDLVEFQRIELEKFITLVKQVC